jgi:hypothetical protein
VRALTRLARARRGRAHALVLALSCLGVCGCGAGVSAADLFIVYRTGSTPHARLTVLVNEEGRVRCNGGPTLQLSDRQLVKARAIQEELQEDAARHLTLPPRAKSVLSYYLRDENGSVRFSDNSQDQPTVLHELQLFVLSVAQQICHLPE